MSKKAEISYRRVGDYLIPNLIIPPEETSVRLGKWGMLYKDYLQKHKSLHFNLLIIRGELYQHCAEVEHQVNEMYELLIEQMKENQGVTEQLKEQDQLEWVGRMTNIKARASEIVNNEIIYI